ncbi:MAG: DNA polymerase III subunit epsilon [Thaumarchaeota archaeon]|nr:DNA polymerase III subunit epsilon [Nitrososphaerota archaeon]
MWVTPSGAQIKSAGERLEDIRDRPDDFRLLERMPLVAESVPTVFGERSGEDTTITFLDIEATSLDVREARIIELGMLRCRYSPEGRLVEIIDVFSGFEDPGMPIPREVTGLTGITDEMVHGERLDPDAVRGWLGRDPLVVAHNARFDRPIFEQRFPDMGDYRWACSLRGIPWSMMGYGSASLPLLLEQEGWFFEAHRAHTDCLAVSWMLHSVPGTLGHLLDSIADRAKVTASGNTYPVKESLKERGYRFDGAKKHWTRIIPLSGLDQEMDFLGRMSYGGVIAGHERVTARTAFKE